MTDLNLTVERTINAPQKAVFDAWLNPKMLQKFMMPAPGMTVPNASNDPKEGGRFDIIMQAGDDEAAPAGGEAGIHVVDCSPDWGYVDGGQKVIVVYDATPTVAAQNSIARYDSAHQIATTSAFFSELIHFRWLCVRA